jgi:DNA primase
MARRLIERRKVRPEDLAEVGLTTAGRRGPMDRFRDRVVFPIRDATGGAVGLGGRLLPRPEADADPRAARDRGPKYLNSPATPLFDKSRTLYLIDRAKSSIRRTGRAIIVEGYTDALMAHQAGFTDVVASLGTALTPGQISVLLRYKKDNELHIGLAYDVDPAGQSAGAFGVRELQQLIGDMQRTETGMSVGVIRLPEGRDPDEVIRDDPARWQEAAARPVGIVEYLIDREADRRDVRTTDGKRGVIDAVMPVLHGVSDPVTRQSYLQHLARRTGVEVGVLADTLRQWRVGGTDGRRADHGPRITIEAVRAASEQVSPEEVLRAITPVEAELLRLLLLVPDEQPRVADELGPDLLPSTLARELFRAIVLNRAPGDDGLRPGFDRTAFLALLDEEVRALAIALLARPGPDPGALPADRIRYEIENLLLDLEADRIEERIQYNRSEQAEAERLGDANQMERLLNQQRAINEERRSLDRRREQARLFARPVAARA